MTSLLPGVAGSSTTTPTDLTHRRPLALLALLGGAGTAAATLLVCLALGVVGWFVSDAGAHGAPRDGLRAGARGWLMGHGSGVSVDGVSITAIPLGVSVLCLWAVWRLAYRVGDSVSGHGPDADAIADGARDWTVPIATALFTAGYAGVAWATYRLADAAPAGQSLARVVAWCLVLGLVVGGLGIAVGAGRAAIWAAFLPVSVRAASMVAFRIVSTLLLASLVTVLVSLALHLDEALNVMSQLHTSAGEAVLYAGLGLAVLPNAALLGAAYLLGPGFAFGTATVVSPTAVALGPVPMVPLLAALPDETTPAPWLAALLLVPPVLAGLAAVRGHRLYPTARWEEAAVRGCVGGIMAGLAIGALTTFAGGAIGPGRMVDVGASAAQVTLHAVVALGLGGLVGALLAAWSYRRQLDRSTTTSG